MRDGDGLEYSRAEYTAILMSRELRDGEVGSPGGARSEIAMAAARLAQLSHAPNLALITSAAGLVTSGIGQDPSPLYRSTTDFRNVYIGTEAVLPFDSIFRTRRDWFFAGALQVDTRGNLNLTCVGDNRRPELRGPGAAGLAYASTQARKFFVYLHEHSVRTLVQRVDFISALGFGDGPDDRAAMGIDGGGPDVVITPRAVMDFETAHRGLRLRSIHAGESVDGILARTGADVAIPDTVPETDPPSRDELTLLRAKVDIRGILREDST